MGRGKFLNLALGGVALGATALGVASIGPPAGPKAQPRLVAVTTGSVQSTVTATGNVQAPASLGVNFKTGGVLTQLMVAPGDRVEKGQALAAIDDTDLRSSYTAAQSNLATAQARLVQATMGLTPAEQAQNQIAAEQAQAAVEQATRSLQYAQAIASINATNYQNAVDQARAQLARDQAQLATDQSQLAADQAQLAADQAQLAADQVATPPNQQTITASQNKVSQSQSKVQSSQAKVTQDLNTIAKDTDQIQGTLNAQLLGLTRDQQTIESAVNALNNAIRSQQSTAAANAVKTQPPKPGDLAAAEASVTSAQIAADNAKRALDGATLVAPIAGTVATVNGKVGETIGTAGTSGAASSAAGGGGGGGGSGTAASSMSGFITLTDVSNLIVKAGFSESDAAKIQLSHAARLTVDALAGVSLAGRVAAIDTVSTVVSNVVTYNVTIALENPPATVKPGMTSTAVVTVVRKDNVLSAPTAAVQGTGANGSVTVIINGKQTRQPVTIGLRGDDTTEIVSGIEDGQEIVISQGTSFAGSGTQRTGTGGAGNTGGRVGAGGTGGAGGLVGGGAGPVTPAGGGR